MESNLTVEEQATNAVTLEHIQIVRNNLSLFIKELLDRAAKHDLSKLEHPEVEFFKDKTPHLSTSTYGSKEYEGFRKPDNGVLAPALKHHYAKNRHHPEHWPSGVDDMNLIDVVEMLCDWAAATTRHHDGNLQRSIEVNTERFHLSPQLVRILENTVELFDS